MREALKQAVRNAVFLECKLPHKESGVDKSCLSTQKDICFNNNSPESISQIIYNGIVEFAVNEYEIDYENLELEQRKAIISRIRYNPDDNDTTKLRYGFYGEVLLDLILRCFMYANISRMPWWFIEEIKRVAISLAQSNAHRINWAGFQIIMDIILPIVQEDKLKRLILQRTGTQQQYSLITVLLSSYLSGGFLSMVTYYVERQDSPKTKDEAIRTVADFVYNVFKYHLVKYLGLFDIFYRHYVSTIERVDMENVAGLGLLLQKLEYNALTPTARKISDYGVPFKLIDCYDSTTPYDKGEFDAYEKYVDEQINKLLL